MTKPQVPPVAEFTSLIVGGLALQLAAVVLVLVDHAVPIDGGAHGHGSTFGLVVGGLAFGVGAASALVGVARLLRELHEFLAEWRWSRAERAADRSA